MGAGQPLGDDRDLGIFVEGEVSASIGGWLGLGGIGRGLGFHYMFPLSVVGRSFF